MDLTELSAASPLLLATAAGLLGLVVGSFINVVSYRLPIMLEREWRAECAELSGQAGVDAAAGVFNLATPRSHCPKCGRRLRVRENIPLFSYIFLRGRCASCQTRIPLQYPVVEALTGALTAVVVWRFGFTGPALAAMLLTWGLIALSVIDLQHQLLPDRLILPFLWLGMGLGLFDVFIDLRSSVIGAMAGYLSLWLVYHGFRVLTGKEGIGYGDFKLLAMLGAWAGWQSLLIIVILSSLAGAVAGTVLIVVRGGDRNMRIPFGPFLAVAGWVTVLWGASLQRLYWNWMAF